MIVYPQGRAVVVRLGEMKGGVSMCANTFMYSVHLSDSRAERISSLLVLQSLILTNQ